MLGDEFVGNWLARIPLLHANDKPLEVCDPMHAWMTARIDNQRLTGNRIGWAEVRDAFAVRSDRRARGDAIIGVIVETGEDAVKVGACVADKLPFAAELF